LLLLQAVRDPSTGRDLQSYCGSPLPVLGVRVPEIRRIARGLVPTSHHAPPSEIRQRTIELWGGQVLEERLLAIEMLGRLREDDWPKSWALADRWVPTASGWALSDSLSMTVFGPLVRAHPEKVSELARWARSKDPWRRRASVYALHRYVRAGDLHAPLAQIERLLDDPEPWVQRAVGTWLRESWKIDAPRIESFLRDRAPRLAPIVRTVATERAPRSFRKELKRRAQDGAVRAASR
jgi:3-methyladenine DNA glycosylase AlkD